MKIVLPAFILVTGFLLMVLLLRLRGEPPKRNTEPRPKMVSAKIAHLGQLPARIVAHGRVTSSQPIELYSEVAGTLVKGDVPFRPGQSFARGDLLLKIDDRQAQLELNSRKSELLTALALVLPEIKVDFPAEYRVWQEYFDACEFDRDLGPLPGTNNQRIKLFLSRFNVYKLYYSVRDLEIRLEKHNFYALFDGTIVSANLRVGSTARNGTLLGKIIDTERMEVEVPVPAEDVQWIDNGSPVRFTSSEIAGEWQGRIKRIGASIDTRTQTVPVFISVDNGHRVPMLDGAFLRAEIPGRIIDRAISIPRRALYNDEYVYLVTEGKLESRRVSVVRREENTVIVNGGIEESDTLVVEVLQGVAPGMPVQAKLLPLPDQGE